VVSIEEFLKRSHRFQPGGGATGGNGKKSTTRSLRPGLPFSLSEIYKKVQTKVNFDELPDTKTAKTTFDSTIIPEPIIFNRLFCITQPVPGEGAVD